VGSAVGKEGTEAYGACPEIRWVPDGAIPGHHELVRVDNELYKVSASSGNLYIRSYDFKTLSLLSPMWIMMEPGPLLSARA
jgi:hypothetical protein